ncbi:hypothetical protein GCM10010174_89840 [Kutzneria viridogrisea]|uniref:Secreted protein n=2 Tax=Kutzneria TaxID=43356 RepID=W5WGJ2_9PSEU|nr:hypothetical protein KALB_6511 [Kutzneria albida DSM 43870]MBA8925051.1 hypothetical protein [Kutzneria viridogrisea]
MITVRRLVALALAAPLLVLAAGTAHAAGNSVTINSATGHGLGVSVNLTYSCLPGSGITAASVTVIASGNTAAGGSAVTCDGSAHTIDVGANCVLPSNNCHFVTGLGVTAYASLSSSVTDSKHLYLL